MEDSIPFNIIKSFTKEILFTITQILFIVSLFIISITYSIPLFLLLVILVLFIIIGTSVALLLKININIILLSIGLELSLLSFIFQPLGPEIRQYGTECKPIENCFYFVKGGGLPVQYVIDKPGISIQGTLGFEDEFRIWSLLVDILFYFVIGLIAYKLTQKYKKKMKYNN